MNAQSTHAVSTELVEEILQAIRSIDGYGSIELYVQNSIVTQITVRNIKKTSVAIQKNIHVSA